jgi:hypothetical protein
MKDDSVKRDLRLRIARQRRRIDHRVRAVDARGRELLSWRTYVRRYPGYSSMAAFGAGLALSAGLGNRLPRWLGQRLVRRGIGQIAAQIGREVRRLFSTCSSDQ